MKKEVLYNTKNWSILTACVKYIMRSYKIDILLDTFLSLLIVANYRTLNKLLVIPVEFSFILNKLRGAKIS